MKNAPICYKPSSFYFRRALRDAKGIPGLLAIVRALRAEVELCRDFARGHGVLDHDDTDGGLFELPEGLAAMRERGLRLCCELEEVKQLIRDHGLTPPKRNIMRSEAEAKGWPLGA